MSTGVDIEFHNSVALTWVLKAIAELIPEATMTITATKISLNGMDSAHIGMFVVHMDLNKLASQVTCADDKAFVIGFRTNVFKNYLSTFNNDPLHLEYNVSKGEDVLLLYQSNDEHGAKRSRGKGGKQERNENEMKLLDIDSEELSAPDRDDWIEVDIEAIHWKKMIKELSQLGYENVELECTLEYLKYSSSGDNGRSQKYLYPSDHDISISAGAEASTSTKLSLSLKMVNQGCGKIEVKPTERMKVRIIGGENGQVAGFNYYLGDLTDHPECTLVYYLAGKIQDED